jgi:hypothetical protein
VEKIPPNSVVVAAFCSMVIIPHHFWEGTWLKHLVSGEERVGEGEENGVDWASEVDLQQLRKFDHWHEGDRSLSSSTRKFQWHG